MSFRLWAATFGLSQSSRTHLCRGLCRDHVCIRPGYQGCDKDDDKDSWALAFRWELLCLVLAGLSLLVGRATAQPTAPCQGGVITSDTIWAAAKSPHQVCSNLVIAAGVTLTIQPGSVVVLSTDVEVTIAAGGRLLAEGTETNRIRFVKAVGTSGWGGITVLGAPDSPETHLAYVDFEGNSKTCLHGDRGTLWLDHANFETTTHQYVSLDESSFLISHCYFPSGTVNFELLHATRGIKAGGRGIVRDCFFGRSSGYNDVADFTGGNRPGPIFQFYHNVFTGTDDDILDLDGTDAWIEGNIFLHAHRNGATPDSSSAISGGKDGSATSELTITRNLFFDCDQAVTAKEGNFYVLYHNTIVHTTHVGGRDNAAGVVNVRDADLVPPTTFGAGAYLEGNVIADAEQLVRNYDGAQTQVTFVNNLLPVEWPGPGRSNLVAEPRLVQVPQVSETTFTNWSDAQVLWEWFRLAPGSPALGAGAEGEDLGAGIAAGVSIAGEPVGATTNTSATLHVAWRRTGEAVPASGWPQGAGYAGYRWRLDAGPWSELMGAGAPIALTNLAPGPHQVAAVGLKDSGLFQDDTALGTNALVTLSRVWTVGPILSFVSAEITGTAIRVQFQGTPGQTYSVEATESLISPVWSSIAVVTADLATGAGSVSESIWIGQRRFYRLTSLSRP